MRIHLILALLLAGCTDGPKTDDDTPDSDTPDDTECLPAAPAAPAGCPEDPEPAYEAFLQTCGMTTDSLELNANNDLTLTAAAAEPVCDDCACQEALQTYYTQYENCTDDDQGNRRFADNLRDIVSACP